MNISQRIYIIFDTGIGYVQCMPETTPPAIYCEAQSAETWAPLSAVLSPERILLLHKAGYTDPGRALNYWKLYPLETSTDDSIAREITGVLHTVYGYTGSQKLEYNTE